MSGGIRDRLGHDGCGSLCCKCTSELSQHRQVSVKLEEASELHNGKGIARVRLSLGESTGEVRRTRLSHEVERRRVSDEARASGRYPGNLCTIHASGGISHGARTP